MQVLTAAEAAEWCASRRVQLTKAELPVIGQGSAFCLEVETIGLAPGRILFLGRTLQTLGVDADSFRGALLWLRRWEMEGEPLVEMETLLFTRLRRGYGANKDLHEAPAHLFAPDELLDASALLGQVMLFGWETLFVPASGQYAVLTSNDERHIVVTPTEADLDAAAERLHEWGWRTSRRPVPW